MQQDRLLGLLVDMQAGRYAAGHDRATSAGCQQDRAINRTHSQFLFLVVLYFAVEVVQQLLN